MVVSFPSGRFIVLYIVLLSVSVYHASAFAFARVYKYSSALMYLSDEHGDEFVPELYRAQIAGVSVAKSGFYVILRLSDCYLPMRVTNDSSDARTASSPEALTLLQLLSGVDMATPILPPDALAKLVVLYCENNRNSSTQAQEIAKHISRQLPDQSISYHELHPWLRSRIRLPKCTLDEVILDTRGICYKVAVKDFGLISVDYPTPEILELSVHQYYESTPSFLAVALSLRYNAPLTLKDGVKGTLSAQELQEKFCMFQSVDQLQQTTSRVTANIERSFKVNNLQAALRIAMQRGDNAAVTKLRHRLDELDKMDDLPVQAESDVGAME